MKLEFELEDIGIKDEKRRFKVLRKGLKVGMLYLDIEPYASPFVDINKMECE
jgi:hypothetical protein